MKEGSIALKCDVVVLHLLHAAFVAVLGAAPSDSPPRVLFNNRTEQGLHSSANYLAKYKILEFKKSYACSFTSFRLLTPNPNSST